MAEYIENVLAQTSKLDWAFPFERKGQFPLDKSSLFSSLADAQAYATGSANDERKLGGTSYVGQIITVYTAATTEGGKTTPAMVNAYMIAPDRSLVKLAATTASGDLASDVLALQQGLSVISDRVGLPGDNPTGLYKDIEEIWRHPQGLGIGARKDDANQSPAHGLWGAVEALEERATALEGKEDKDTTYSVAEGDKVLKLTDTKFSTELGLKHENGKISLTGIGGAVIAEFSDADFIADGVLEDVSYDAETKELTFTWNVLGTDGQKKTDVVDISDLIDTYTAGNGIDITGAVVSAKVKTDDKYLKVDTNGLYTTGIDEAIAKAIEELPKEDNNTTYTIGTEDSEKKVKVILTPNEGEAQKVEVNAYNTTTLDKMLYEGSYDKDGESIPSNVAEADRSKARLITPDEIKKLSVLELGEGGVEISGNVNANNVTGLGQAITDKVTGATSNGGLGIESGAQVNVIEEVQVNGTALVINDKKVNIAVPTKLSQLTDDKGYLTNVKMKDATVDGEGQTTYAPWLIVENGASSSDVRVIDDSAIQSKVNAAQKKADDAYALAERAGEDAEDLFGNALVGVKLGNKAFDVKGQIASLTAAEGRAALELGALALEDSIDTGVHSVALTSGTNDGTLKLTVDGVDQDNIAVTGLGALAFEDSIDTGVHSVELAGGTNNGTLKLTIDGADQDNIAITGLDTMAYEKASDYYTALRIAQIIGFEDEFNESGMIPGDSAGDHVRPSVLAEIAKLKQDIGNVSNIMNFRGVVTATDAGFDEDVKAIADPKDGDVILYKAQEHVYSNGAWVLFGDAGADAAAITALTERVGDLETATSVTLPGAIGDALQAAKDYADAQDALTLAAANDYTDNAIAALNLGNYTVQSIASGHDAITVNNVNGVVTIGLADEIILNGGKA